MVRSTVLLFVILGHTPLILLVCLVGLMYLTWVELRREELEPMVQLWWYLLVFLFNLAWSLQLTDPSQRSRLQYTRRQSRL